MSLRAIHEPLRSREHTDERHGRGSRLAAAVFLVTLLTVATSSSAVLGVVDPGIDVAPSVPSDNLPTLVPKANLPDAPDTEINVSVAPEVPPPSGRQTQAIVDVHFEVVENVVAIDPNGGVEYETWGYRINGDDRVVPGTPGPMIRARVGDVLRFTITNPAGNSHAHNVDFHAVTGQGGGAADTTVLPGETRTIEGRLLYPGMFMYHCAFGDVPLHIAHGMYGGILVDPEAPLPPAEKELYIVQSEFYTTTTEAGLVETDRQAITDENPSIVVFNGATDALTGDNAPSINVGDRLRIYFVNAGVLNLISSFHPIGSHWDVVYPEAALLNEPIYGSQTTLVPAGGGTVVELIGQVPSNIILVDHALSRVFDKGAIGIVTVVGEANPEIFEGFEAIPIDDDGTPSDPEATPSDTEPVASGEEVTVVMLPDSWSPQPMGAADEFADVEDPADYSANVLTVPAGTTVTWVQADPGQIHTATAVDGSFDSGFLSEGDTWSKTFDTAGEFEYFCVPHPWMRAKVIVEA